MLFENYSLCGTGFVNRRTATLRAGRRKASNLAAAVKIQNNLLK
jgi:hypothetical protein